MYTYHGSRATLDRILDKHMYSRPWTRLRFIPGTVQRWLNRGSDYKMTAEKQTRLHNVRVTLILSRTGRVGAARGLTKPGTVVASLGYTDYRSSIESHYSGTHADSAVLVRKEIFVAGGCYH